MSTGYSVAPEEGSPNVAARLPYLRTRFGAVVSPACRRAIFVGYPRSPPNVHSLKAGKNKSFWSGANTDCGTKLGISSSKANRKSLAGEKGPAKSISGGAHTNGAASLIGP